MSAATVMHSTMVEQLSLIEVLTALSLVPYAQARGTSLRGSSGGLLERVPAALLGEAGLTMRLHRAPVF